MIGAVWQILGGLIGAYVSIVVAVQFAQAGRPVLPAHERPDAPDVTCNP